MKGNCIERAETIQQVCWGYEKNKMHAIENEEENYSTQNNFDFFLYSRGALFPFLIPFRCNKKCNFLMNEKRERKKKYRKTCLDFSSRLLLFHIQSLYILVYYAFFHLEPFLCFLCFFFFIFCETFKKSFLSCSFFSNLHCVRCICSRSAENYQTFLYIMHILVLSSYFFFFCCSEREGKKNFWNAFTADAGAKKHIILWDSLQLCAAIASLHFCYIFLSFISVLHALPLIFFLFLLLSILSFYLLAILCPFMQLMHRKLILFFGGST